MSRHVIVGPHSAILADPAFSPPSVVDVGQPLYGPITPARFREFHALMRDYRHAQDLFDTTSDPVVRRVAQSLADQVDAAIGWLAADFAAASAVQWVVVQADADQLDAVEGGGL